MGLLAFASCVSQPASAQKTPALGESVGGAEIARWDISIPPSGEGLPKGGGTARQGAAIYQAKCQACHGEKGTGELADPLAGGIGTLASRTPVRTVGSYWPYATTLFDYVRRAMPLTNPLSLTDDEVYAVSAYVLFLNGIIGADVAVNAQTLPRIKMPNREGFIGDWPPR
jgi:cytochrome c